MKSLVAMAALLVSVNCFAIGADEAVSDLQTRWADIKYSLEEDQQEDAFKALAEESEQYLLDNPDSAEVKIWRGIVLSTYAGAKGGLGALKLVKEAKALFESVLDTQPNALNGSAYTSLGSLYYQVPSWPIGFGSDKKAAEHLKKALAINPDGIDSNYFYADFLVEQGDKTEAVAYLEHALEAPRRPGRELADEGRRAEVNALLAKLKAH
jgi:tetratricopeptide (TPR) repeat protein